MWPLLIAAYPLIIFFDILVTRHQTGFLDNTVHYVSYQLFFSHVFHGELPLWTSCQAGGMALWPLVDMHAMWDPVVWIIFGVSVLSRTSGFHAFQWCIAWWLACFGCGIFFLLKEWKVKAQSAALAGVVATASSLSLISWMQANGFLMHVYLVPWLWLALIRWHRHRTLSWAFLSGILLGLWISGYMAPLACIVLLLAFLCFCGWRRFSIREFMPSIRELLAFGIAVFPFALANVLTLWKTQEWTPVARIAAPSGNTGQFVLSFFSPLFVEPGARNVIEATLTAPNSFIGTITSELFFFCGSIPLFLIILALTQKSKPALRAWTRWFFVFLLVVFGLYCGLGQLAAYWWSEDGVFLQFRNWRFLYPYLVLGMSLFVGLIWDGLTIERWSLSIAAWLFFVLAGYGVMQNYYSMLPLPAGLLLTRLIFPVTAVALCQRLKRRKGKSWASCLLILFCLAESSHFVRSWMPSLLPFSRPDILEREPSLDLRSCGLPEVRETTFPIRQFAPFHKEGPAVWAYPAVSFDWEINMQPPYLFNRQAIQYFYPAASHWFEPTAYLEFLQHSENPHSWAGIRSSSGTVLRQVTEPAYLKLQSNASEIHYLSIANGFDSDWRASVDGKAVAISRVENAFQLVAVPEGKHTVELRYQPMAWLWSFWLRAGVMLTAVILLLNRTKRLKFTSGFTNGARH